MPLVIICCLRQKSRRSGESTNTHHPFDSHRIGSLFGSTAPVLFSALCPEHYHHLAVMRKRQTVKPFHAAQHINYDINHESYSCPIAVKSSAESPSKFATLRISSASCGRITSSALAILSICTINFCFLSRSMSANMAAASLTDVS